MTLRTTLQHLASLAHHETHRHAPAPRPMVGIAAVLLGAVISTLFGRLTTFGLADIRGAVHAGFDEGAWIPTAATVAQMFVGPPAVWLGAAFGPRRVLSVSATLFAVAMLLLPFSPNLQAVLFFQVLGGLGCGTFIPLTIGFVLQSLPQKWWPFGIAAYGLNLELSLNIPASLEGWYLDHLDWRWIFWQNALLAVPMLLCVRAGMPRPPVNRALLDRVDPWGMFYAGAGFSLLYAALDQGNRLDWLNSGDIVGMLLGGVVLLVAFVGHELVSPRPWINLRFLLGRNIVKMLILLGMYRFALLSTNYIIPQYLTTVQNFRSLEVGDVLIWIAVPQVVLAPLIAYALRWIDPRTVLALGIGAVGLACLLAMQLTQDWQTGEFLPSQVLQAFGQSAALIALVLFFIRHLRPADALTFGVILQTTRLFGGEIGTAFMATFVRMSEQANSYLLGLHIRIGDTIVSDRVAAYAAALAPRSNGAAEASLRASSLLGQTVRTQANILSFIDGFGIVVGAVIVMLVVVALLRRPPPAPAPG
jgi:DHA2 family multidrug resistance protein